MKKAKTDNEVSTQHQNSDQNGRDSILKNTILAYIRYKKLCKLAIIKDFHQ